ncbi:MAG: hypothetical protein IT375_34860 [Polyangiaceae bacterium]|nr:hypothetical protein [Polyangiaceae bacterium]
MAKKSCPRCGWSGGPSPVRLGESLPADLAFFTVTTARRARAGNKRAATLARILDMLFLADHRDDDALLRQLGAKATAYGRRRHGEPTLAGGFVLDNASVVRALVSKARPFADLTAGQATARAVLELFPYLPRVTDRQTREVNAIGAELEAEKDQSPEHLAERALILAGMPAAEAHQRFAFLRVARSRAVRARQKAHGAKH